MIKDDSGDVIGGVEALMDLPGLKSSKREIFNEYSFNDNTSKDQKIFQSSNKLQLAEENISSVLISNKGTAVIELPLLKHAEKSIIIEVLGKKSWNMMKTAEEL